MRFRSYYWPIGFIVITAIQAPFIELLIASKSVPTLFIVLLIAPYAALILILIGWTINTYNVDHYLQAIKENVSEQGLYQGHAVQYRTSIFNLKEKKDLFMFFTMILMMFSVRRQNFDLVLSVMYSKPRAISINRKFSYFFRKGIILKEKKAEFLLNIFWKINGNVVRQALDRLVEAVDNIEQMEPAINN